MQTLKLGKTGLQVSRVGMGGIPITRPTETEAVRVIQCAIDLGINFIDSSRGYYTSEERIGKAIAGRRDQVIIATKGVGDRETSLKHIEESLESLNTDYIDLWQFHGVNNTEVYEKILAPGGGMEGAQEALQAGKIRHIGVSTHSSDMTLKIVTSGHFETVMVPFNFVARDAADELIPLAKKHDVGFIAMKPFGGSRLHNANLAIKYQLQFDNVVPIPGIEKVEQVEEIVGLVNGPWQLSDQEQQEIEAIRAQMDTLLCRRCNRCVPCPQGVAVHSMMNLPGLWKLWSPDFFFSWRYVEHSVESAKKCDDCGECEEKCPYDLPIREMMKENLAFFERVQGEYQASIEQA